jgi:hypothetical protein
MAKGERFTVNFVLTIEGDQGFLASAEQNYADMSYDTMQICQHTIVKALTKALVGLGDAKVTDKKALALADSLV